MQVDWSIFKQFVDSRSLSIQWIDLTNQYWLKAFDDSFSLECYLDKSVPDTTNIDDFEANYKTNGNKRLSAPSDSDGSPLSRAKITTSGWSYQMHNLEFKTSQLDSLYSKKQDGTDFGFITIKCYDSNGNQLSSQEDCDTSAVETIVDWEPNHDYEIVGGNFKQTAIPTENIRLWVVGVPDVPANYGGSKLFVTGVNLKYLGLEEGVKADGRAPKYLTYNATYHTNKLRFILKHDAGFKHDIQATLEIFKG